MRGLSVDPENAGLVAVEGDWLAVLLDVAAGRGEVVERRLGAHEADLHDAPGGIVDEDQEHAPRCTRFEPLVVAAVDLDELTEARPPLPRWVRTLPSLSAGDPEPGADHPLPQGFERYPDAVQLRQLLAGQGRPKVRVAGPYELQNGRTLRFWLPVPTRSSALSRNQRRRPAGLERPVQPLDLSKRQVQLLGDLHLGPSALPNEQHQLRTIQLSFAHDQVAHRHAGGP